MGGGQIPAPGPLHRTASSSAIARGADQDLVGALAAPELEGTRFAKNGVPAAVRRNASTLL